MTESGDQELDQEFGGGASESTEPAWGSSTSTDVSLKEHLELNAGWEWRYDNLDRRWTWRFMQERDRRYAEVQAERDKAEVISRETQTYKDMKANELREQIADERGRYVTQNELVSAMNEIKAILGPIVEYVASQRGSREGATDFRQLIAWGVATALGIWAVVQAFGV